MILRRRVLAMTSVLMSGSSFFLKMHLIEKGAMLNRCFFDGGSAYDMSDTLLCLVEGIDSRS